MISDARLVFSAAQRPPAVVAGIGVDYTFTPCPSGYELAAGTSKSLDLQTTMDLGVGNVITARFEVTTSFVGATNYARFVIAISDSPDFATNTQIVVRSQDWAAAGLVKGIVEELYLPQLGSLARLTHSPGSQYIGVGLEILAPTADFSAGAMNARFVLNTNQEQLGGVVNYPTGWVVA